MSLDLTVEHLESLVPFFKGKRGIRGSSIRNRFHDLDELIVSHFEVHSSLEHGNRSSLDRALRLLNGLPAYVVETGSAAWGTNSTLLFDSYVNSFGGKLVSVDIRLEPAYRLSRQCSANSELYCDDSLAFLKKLGEEKVNLFYLDSFDLDPLDPLPAMVHGLHEFLIILPKLKKQGGYVLIDDSPRNSEQWERLQGSRMSEKLSGFYQNFGVYPGKGALVAKYLESSNCAKILWWDYQLMLQFEAVC
jgi:hypothetical protein